VWLIPFVIFGITEPTPYCAQDPAHGMWVVTAWFHDTFEGISNRELLVYRESYQPGMNGAVSVYRIRNGIEASVIEERSTDDMGNVTGIQRYTPEPPLVYSSFGSYSYCQVFTGDTCDPEPVQNSWYKYWYMVSVSGDNVFAWEQYAADHGVWYDRTFVYDRNDVGHTLVSFHDNVTGLTSYRHRGVDSFGFCYGRY
jgi:hypothetical protein